MKRIVLTVLITLLLILPACSEKTAESEDLSARLRELSDFSAEAVVTADFSDRTTSFRVSAAASDGVCEMAVLEPVELEGITVTLENGALLVECDGASFEAGSADELGVAPITAVAELRRLWTSAVPRESGREQYGVDCLLAVYASGTSETRVWLDVESLEPVAAEFYTDGRRTIVCEFVSFVIGGS